MSPVVCNKPNLVLGHKGVNLRDWLISTYRVQTCLVQEWEVPPGDTDPSVLLTLLHGGSSGLTRNRERSYSFWPGVYRISPNFRSSTQPPPPVITVYQDLFGRGGTAEGEVGLCLLHRTKFHFVSYVVYTGSDSFLYSYCRKKGPGLHLPTHAFLHTQNENWGPCFSI